MSDTAVMLIRNIAAAASVVLMGVCGIRLLAGLTRVIRGQAPADAMANARERKRFAPWRRLLAVFLLALLSRVLVYLMADLMRRMAGMDGGFFEVMRPLWCHWDTRHYIAIAENGYVPEGDERLRLVFFPLMPMLMRLLSPLTGGDVFYAGLLISLLCSGAAAALLYDLSYLHFGRRAAGLSAAYFLLSPMSVFLNCCYTEALFLCLVLAAMCLMRRGRPWLAAVCGMGCALTRMPGVIVAGLMIISLIGKAAQCRAGLRAVLSCAGQVLTVFSGLFIYWAINYAVTGDPLMYLTYQRENWFQQAGSFWGSVSNTVYYVLTAFGEDDWFFTWGFQLIAMFYVFALLAAGTGKLPFDLMAYSFVYTAVVLSPTWLLSGARYLYALAPLHILKAVITKRSGLHALALGVSGVLLLVFIYAYTIMIRVL